MAFTDDFELRRIHPVAPGEAGYEAAMTWLKAVSYGFHNPGRSTERAAEAMVRSIADRTEFIGVYRKAAQPGFDIGWPVATFESFRKDLNIGSGRMLRAELISAVTVRSDHRRLGILREMMQDDLRRARDEGIAVAALTVSEGSIYRRFGFGVATQERSITVDSSKGLDLVRQTTGVVRNVPRQDLFDLAPKIFAEVHARQPGSIDWTESYRYYAAGKMGKDGEDKDVISAVHYSANGVPDGYASYKYSGWDETPRRLDIVDLVAADDVAYLELWQFLGSVDLTTRIVWEDAPLVDPMQWALADPRLVESTRQRDMIWLRILDVRRAFAAREYQADGRLVIEVADQMGLAGGRFELEVRAGQANVTELSDESGASTEPDLSLDIADLGSVYLGGVLPSSLLAAGRIVEHRAGAARLLQLMLAPERAVHCLSHF